MMVLIIFKNELTDVYPHINGSLYIRIYKFFIWMIQAQTIGLFFYLLNQTFLKQSVNFVFINDGAPRQNLQVSLIMHGNQVLHVMVCPLYTLLLKSCRHAIIDWNRCNHWNSKVHITRLQDQFDSLKKSPSWDGNAIRKVEKELANKIHNEEIYQTQKSQINQFKQGDKNTAFFHAQVIQRRMRNFIVWLLNNSRTQRSSLFDIQIEILLFTTSRISMQRGTLSASTLSPKVFL